MIAADCPIPIAFCRITLGTQMPVMPKATHCAAMKALFVQTCPANEPEGSFE